MFSIIHTIELFDDETYINELLPITPKLCKKSPQWTTIIFVRILNSEPSRIELIRQLSAVSEEVKKAIHDTMTKINEQDYEFLQKTVAVLAASA